MPLKSRRQFPPGGFLFFEPKTGWSAPGGVTFEECVAAIIQHRQSNPRFAGQWQTDTAGVSDELDNYTCLRLGNDVNYCDDNAPPVFLRASQSQRHLRSQTPRLAAGLAGVSGHATKTFAGVGLVLDWLGDGLKPVEKELAEKRAAVCVECPLNQKGDFWVRIESWLAKKIKTCLAIRADMNVSTSLDDRLHSCLACDCDLKLKTTTPIEHIKAHTSDAVKKDLEKGNNCWIISEMKAL